MCVVEGCAAPTTRFWMQLKFYHYDFPASVYLQTGWRKLQDWEISFCVKFLCASERLWMRKKIPRYAVRQISCAYAIYWLRDI